MTKIVLIGKQGTGKSALADKLQELSKDIHFVESYTTRPRRYANETGHTFITPQEFSQFDKNDLLTLNEMTGYYYFMTPKQVQESNLVIIEPNGLLELVTVPANYLLVYLTSNSNERKDKVLNRNQTTEEYSLRNREEFHYDKLFLSPNSKYLYELKETASKAGSSISIKTFQVHYKPDELEQFANEILQSL